MPKAHAFMKNIISCTVGLHAAFIRSCVGGGGGARRKKRGLTGEGEPFRERG